MRAGGYTVHQSLTAEAAAVLKLALALARSRGHAQVTPLHVAFTLLGSSSSLSPSPAYGLLRRACAKAHPCAGACSPAGASLHRALELCFNVALNRLPATANAVGGSPLSSSSSSGASSTPFAASLLVHPNPPTLSNALVAALKRAQARGCVELQSQPPTPTAQQQPLLTLKVELDQLVVSILDDPSVSRVMREAGFSSAAVKASLEEESAMMLLGLGNDGNHHGSSTTSSPSPAPAAPVPPQLCLEPYGAGDSLGGALWPAAKFLNRRGAEFESTPSKAAEEADVRAILEVMSSRRQGRRRRANPAVVADSASAAEASVAELMRRLEIGDVPDELRGAHVLRLHLSHVHVRLMARADADAWAADLRRTVAACAKPAALVIYVGDMRWAVGDDVVRSYSAAEHMAAALARMLGELQAAGRACWLVAAASYTTYMLCQRRALDATWALQPVSVPTAGCASGTVGLGLALGTRAASPRDNKIARFPLLDLEPEREDGAASLCAECARNFESEASAVRAKAEGTNLALSYFPGWPQADEPQRSHKDDLMDLKRKWSRLCQRLHLQHNHPARPSNAKSSDPAVCLSLETPSCHGASMVNHRDVETTLSLLLPNSTETSMDEVHQHRSEHPDLMAKSCDKKSVSGLWSDELLPSGDRKRKDESGRPQSESKRPRGSGGFDLNLCADEEEDGSEDEPVPSDLTNDGEGSSGGVTDSLDSRS